MEGGIGERCKEGRDYKGVAPSPIRLLVMGMRIMFMGEWRPSPSVCYNYAYEVYIFRYFKATMFVYSYQYLL